MALFFAVAFPNLPHEVNKLYAVNARRGLVAFPSKTTLLLLPRFDILFDKLWTATILSMALKAENEERIDGNNSTLSPKSNQIQYFDRETFLRKRKPLSFNFLRG